MEFSCDLGQFNDYQVKEHIFLTHAVLKSINTDENPDNVAPISNGNAKVENGVLQAILCDKSFHVIRLGR